MFVKKTLGLGIAAMALSTMMGCCETTGDNSVNCRPAPAPAVNTGYPLLLESSGICRDDPPPKSRPQNTCGEVQGDLVYNLGQGAISNSSAVRLAGGVENPKAIRVPGGVPGRCNPVPERYYETLRRNAAGVKAPAAPVAAAPARAAAPAVAPAPIALQEPDVFEPGLAAGGFCAPVACPVLPGSAEVCKPGDNLSACFTLSESELASGPTVFVPRDGEIIPAPPAESIPAPVAIPASEPVARTDDAANSSDKYVNLGKAEALAPPPSLDKEPEAKAETAQAPAAFPAAPAEAKGESATAEPMPPVPQVTDMEDAVDAVMTREGYNTSSLPEVKLPPKLN